jgi:hypothetical protein
MLAAACSRIAGTHVTDKSEFNDVGDAQLRGKNQK